MGERLRLLAVQLAGIAGLLHVGLGLREWMLYARGRIVVPPDVRVPLWTVSGMAILFGIVVTTYRPRYRRPLYAAGAAVLVGYALAYYSWHLTGHRSLFFVGGAYPHDVGAVEFLLDHTFAGPVEFVALVTELGGAAALLALLRRE